MTRESIYLNFADPDLAQALAVATPPEGVKVSDPSTLIQASDPAQVLTQIVIEFVPLRSRLAWLKPFRFERRALPVAVAQLFLVRCVR
jgi:hypothetical protein